MRWLPPPCPTRRGRTAKTGCARPPHAAPPPRGPPRLCGPDGSTASSPPAAVEAVDAGDEPRFHELFDQMLQLVRAAPPLNGDELEESDVILPPPDLTFHEAGSEFTGEGLIPG